MSKLLVSATPLEIEPALNRWDIAKPRTGDVYFRQGVYGAWDLLITGAGIHAMAFHLGRVLAKHEYEAVLNVGIAGAYDEALSIGEVVHVSRDAFADLGGVVDGRFRTLSGLRLMQPDTFPFRQEKLHNDKPWDHAHVCDLPAVDGLTVNTVSEAPPDGPLTGDVESMEGAAFLYACLYAGVPCAQVRAVSNYVRPRQKAGWDIKKAVHNLNEWLEKVTG